MRAATALQLLSLLLGGSILRGVVGCKDGDLRLRGSSLEGLVEFCSEGMWEAVCGDSWSSEEASVVCRELDLSGYEAQVLDGTDTSNLFNLSVIDIAPKQYHCGGDESSLRDCDSSTFSCSLPAGVRCQACRVGEVRLAGERSNATEGRVEVCFANEWQAVCDDAWDILDATVVCRQLGFNAVNAIMEYGGGEGDILPWNVNCNGRELTLLQCPGVCRATCRHREDSGVTCSERYPVIHSLDFEQYSRTLTCSSEGQSTKFQWSKDGVDLNETASRRKADSSVALYESRLVLNQSDTDIAGNYSCTVYNNIGTSSQTLSVMTTGTSSQTLSVTTTEVVLASCVEGENSTTTNSTDQSRESSDALPGHINEGILGSFLGILLLANVALIVLIIIFKVLKRKKKTLPLHRENSSGQKRPEDPSAMMHEVDNNIYGMDENKSLPPTDSILLDWSQLPSSYEQPVRFGRDDNNSVVEHEVDNNMYGMEEDYDDVSNLDSVRASKMEQDSSIGQATTNENDYDYCHTSNMNDIVYEEPSPDYASVY